MERDRTDSGMYMKKYTATDVIDVFEASPVPVLTAPEVADEMGCSRMTARNLLEELVESDRLHRKKVGARAVVYIRLEAEGGRLSGYGEWKQGLWDE